MTAHWMTDTLVERLNERIQAARDHGMPNVLLSVEDAREAAARIRELEAAVEKAYLDGFMNSDPRWNGAIPFGGEVTDTLRMAAREYAYQTRTAPPEPNTPAQAGDKG